MYILGIDTSGREGSIALATGDEQSFEVLEFRPLAGGMYSAELVPRIAEVLSARQLAKGEIELFAVCSGPGSFTGLRVGLSVVKGLAEVLQRPIVAVTVLEAICIYARQEQMAFADPPQGSRVISALDAQRGEVFVAEYDFETALPKRVSETLSTLNDLTTWLSARVPAPAVYTPDAAVEKKVRESGTPAQLIARPAADSYARIGLAKFMAGETVSVGELDADYIRRSDAEIFSAPKPR